VKEVCLALCPSAGVEAVAEVVVVEDGGGGMILLLLR
jgi:hypothetical protein